MADRDAERNLLVGVLAWQMKFISREALLAGLQSCTLENSPPLGRILVERQELSADRLKLIEALAEERLKEHGGDPLQTVTAIDGALTILNDVQQPAATPADPFGTLEPTALDKTEPARGRSARSIEPSPLRFQVLRFHARGGLGIVSVALDAELKREVALKELLNQHADNPASRSRFILEAEVTGILEHPGIVPVYGLGEYPDGRPYYAMRFIRGGSLADAIRRFHAAGSGTGSNVLELRRLLRRFIDVCNAVAYAHSRGVLHRDLKPDNVMLGEYGETLVVDWGLAKVTGRRDQAPGQEELLALPELPAGDSSQTVAGFAIGTPQYMSPEQAAGQLDRLGPASDVYCLGATLYSVLTGSPPFHDLTVRETLKRVQTGEFPRPRQRRKETPIALEAICLKAMSLDPEQRYHSVRALADDLEHWLADEPVTAYRESWSQRAARFGRRHRTWTQATAAALLAITVVSAFAVYITRQQRNVAARLASENEGLAATESTLRKAAEKQAAFLAFERSYAECFRADAAQGMNALALCLREASRVGAAETENSIRIQLAGWTRYIQPLEYVMRQGETRVSCVAFSPDSRLVLAGHDDGTAQLWTLETGNPVGGPMRHEKQITAVAFDPSGKTLLTASFDKTVCFRDAETGAEQGARLVHPQAVTSAVFSPDGQRVATGCLDHQGRLWDVPSASVIGTFVAHEDQVSSVAFSPDGKKVVTASHDKTARFWDAETGLPVGPVLRHTDEVHAVAYGPLGKFVATGSGNAEERNGMVHFWDAESGRAAGPPLVHQDSVRSLAVSPDGKTLLTGSNDHMARLWDLSDGRTIGSPLMHNGVVTGVTFSSDGRRILTGSGAGPARVWNASMHGNSNRTLDHSQTVLSVAFDPTGNYVLTAGEEGKTRIWSAKNEGDEGTARTIVREYPGTVAAFSSDGRIVVTGSTDHTARRWDATTGQQIGAAMQHSTDITDVAISHDGKFLLTHTSEQVSRLWQVEPAGSGEQPRLVRRWECRAAVFSPDGKTILSGGDDGRAQRQATLTGDTLGEPFVQQKPVLAVAFSPDGKTILTGSEDGTARLWNIETGKLAGRPMWHRHQVVALAFSPDGKTILTGSDDNTARIWETNSQLQIGPPLKHQGSVRAVAFRPDGRVMLTGSVDGAARFWDVSEPVAGDVEKVILWTQVITGLALEENGILEVLDAQAWNGRRQRLTGMSSQPLP